MNVLFFTPPSKSSFVRLGRCGGKSKGGEKWPPVKMMFAAGAIRGIASVKILDAEGRMPEKVFLEEVRKFTPHLLVFEPTPGSITAENECLATIKGIFPSANSIALGGFASPMAQTLLQKFGYIDFVIDGEAEIPLREFIKQGGKAAVNGMWYRMGDTPLFAGKSELIRDLNDLPFPAHDLIDKTIYSSPIGKQTPSTITETSRGCPHQCIFCNAKFMDGNVPRFRDVERVIEELKFIKKCGFREVKFNDETFTLDKARTLSFAEKLRKTNLDLTWKCNTRADCLDDELLESMAAAGCHAVYIGVESAHQEIQRYYRKGISLTQVENVVKLAKKRGVTTILHFIFGAPEESWETVKATVRFACKVNPDYVGFNLLTPYPGTELFHDLNDKQLIIDDEPLHYDQSGNSVIRTEHLSADDLQMALRFANRSFYFRPSYLLKKTGEMSSPRHIRSNVSGLIGLLRGLLIK